MVLSAADLADFKIFPWSDVVDWNVAIRSCRSRRAWNFGLILLETMEQNLLKPDIISYSTSTSQLPWIGALSMMLRMTQQIALPNVVTYGGAIHACQKAGQWKAALDLFFAMDGDAVPNVVIFNTVISACEACETGEQWQLAMHLLSLMPMRRLLADEVSFNSVISVCEQCCQWQIALDVFSAMMTSMLLPNLITFNSTISACSKASQPSKGLALIRAMREQHLRADIISYNSIITADIEQMNGWQRSCQMLDDLMMASILPSSITYNSVISAVDWQTTLGLLTMTPMATVITFSSAIDGSHWTLALELQRCMLPNTLRPNVITFSSTITSCQKTGLWQWALTLLDAMDARAVAPNGMSFNGSIGACETGQKLQKEQSSHWNSNYSQGAAR